MVTRLLKLYLALVPIVVAALAFAIGHLPYTVYVPIWIIHSCFMMGAGWQPGARFIRSSLPRQRQTVVIALLLVLPWIFISIFFGMGPPPPTIAEWVATATEQQVRYGILIGAGVLIAAGLMLLREQLKGAGETVYSTLGTAAIMLAIPLFIINMAFWGGFLTSSFSQFVSNPSAPRPGWYTALKELFYIIGLVEVALIYLATAAFAASLKKTGLFRPAACRIYIVVSSIFFLMNLVPPSWPAPFSFISYFVSIPAIPFVMPYLIGLNLLESVGRLQTH